MSPVVEDGAPKPRGPARHRVKVLRRWLARWFVVSLGPPLVRALARTWRPVVEGEHNVHAARGTTGGHFMALWHGRMLVAVAHHARRDYHVLVSPSGDGDVISALLHGLGYGTVRGSSRGRGAPAVRQMLELLQRGAGIGVTPDGPTGPMHSMSPSLAWMARETGYAVVPCGFAAARAWHAASWDRFTIPRPYTRVAFVYEEPVRVARDADDAALARASEEIRARLLRAERRGFELLGAEPDG